MTLETTFVLGFGIILQYRGAQNKNTRSRLIQEPPKHSYTQPVDGDSGSSRIMIKTGGMQEYRVHVTSI